jgi:hypothetical protein
VETIMRTFAMCAVLAVLLVGTSFGQATASGSNIVENFANNGVVRSGSFIDASVFSGDICAKINAAINYIGLNNMTSQPYGVTIDARGILPAVGSPLMTCANNPFTGTYAAGITGRLLLPPALITTNVQWTMPNQYFWIEGTIMANMAGSVGTVIRASSTFTCGTGALSISVTSPALSGCPVVFISGSGSTNGVPYVSQGTGIRNLTIDCAGVTGCIGAGSYDVQEGGGIDGVGFINQTIACIAFNAAQTATGSVGISNPFLRNVNCTFSTPLSSAIGIYVNAQNGPAEISNTTVGVPGLQNQNEVLYACLDLNGGRGTNVNYLHCEHAVTAEIIGDSNLVHNVTVNGLTASATGLGVNIKNTGDYDINVQSVELEPGPSPAPNALKDGTNSVTITTPNVAQYTNGGGTIFTTDRSTTNYLGTQSLALVSDTWANWLRITRATAGLVVYCSDCQPSSGTASCSAGGSGALAVWNGSQFSCK